MKRTASETITHHSLLFYLGVCFVLSSLKMFNNKARREHDQRKTTSGVMETFNYIMKTCPCKVYPLKPHFYIVKLGFAGVYLFFLFLLQNIDSGYSLEPPRRGGSNVYPQSMF